MACSELLHTATASREVLNSLLDAVRCTAFATLHKVCLNFELCGCIGKTCCVLLMFICTRLCVREGRCQVLLISGCHPGEVSLVHWKCSIQRSLHIPTFHTHTHIYTLINCFNFCSKPSTDHIYFSKLHSHYWFGKTLNEPWWINSYSLHKMTLGTTSERNLFCQQGFSFNNVLLRSVLEHFWYTWRGIIDEWILSVCSSRWNLVDASAGTVVNSTDPLRPFTSWALRGHATLDEWGQPLAFQTLIISVVLAVSPLCRRCTKEPEGGWGVQWC